MTDPLSSKTPADTSQAEADSPLSASSEKRRTWLLPMLASLLLSFTACIFAPLETYLVSV